MPVLWRFLTLLLAVAFGATGGGAGPASGAPRGDVPTRSWRGLPIQPLDPPPGAAAAAQAPNSPPDLVVPTSPASKPSDVVLSNERTVTRWAYIATLGPIYAGPSARTHRVGRLRRYTEDGFPEIYLLLRLQHNTAGRDWVKLRIPTRPNGRVGWVRREALGHFRMTRDLLVVDRGQLRMDFFTAGRHVWSAPVGVGKPGTPTPPGRFLIRERFKILDPRSGYAPYAFGTSDYSSLSDWPGGGVVGIHGPYFDPGAIPGRPSHGCIRLHVGDDAWLGKHLRLGTPLRVL